MTSGIDAVRSGKTLLRPTDAVTEDARGECRSGGEHKGLIDDLVNSSGWVSNPAEDLLSRYPSEVAVSATPQHRQSS